MVVNEYFMNWWTAIRHVYSWDGMKPCNPVAEFAMFDEAVEKYVNNYEIYEMGDFSKYALIDIDEDGEPELWLSTDDEEYQAVLSIVEGKLTLVAGKDYKRHLIFCKGVVGDIAHAFIDGDLGQRITVLERAIADPVHGSGNGYFGQ